jgi:hypothetical protein
MLSKAVVRFPPERSLPERRNFGDVVPLIGGNESRPRDVGCTDARLEHQGDVSSSSPSVISSTMSCSDVISVNCSQTDRNTSTSSSSSVSAQDPGDNADNTTLTTL